MRAYRRQLVKTLLGRTLFGIKFVQQTKHTNVKHILLVNLMVLGSHWTDFHNI